VAVALFEKDPYVEALDGAAAAPASGTPPEGVRRPLGGLVVAEETFANLSVLARDENGTTRYWSLLDQGGAEGVSETWSNFILQQVQEQRMEKAQVVQTFGEDFYFFFGQEPRFLMCSGVVFAADNFKWASEFTYIYENYLRGTRCAENKARVILRYEGIIVQGMLISMSMTRSSEQPHAIPLVFNFAVVDYRDTNTPPMEAGDLGAVKPHRSYPVFRSRTASIPAGNYQLGGSYDEVEVAYNQVRGDYVRSDPNQGTLRPARGPSGSDATDENQPYAYTDAGKLAARARTAPGSEESRLSFVGRDRALLDLDLLAQGSSLSAADAGEARHTQKQQGAGLLSDRSVEDLRTLLTPGNVGVAALVL
jgi:hypothetical protein